MFYFVTLIVASLAVFAAAQEYPKVNVGVYYEALCPGCQQFITTTLTNTLAKSDIVAITNLVMVPYGNTKKNTDGSFTCQHGADECVSDAYEMCTMYKLSGNLSSIATGDTVYQAWPFVHCLEAAEGDPSAAAGCFSSTMKNSGLDWSTVTACAANEYSAVQNEGAKDTPKHDYVPWVLVEGQLLENTNTLLTAICRAYTGPAPASCKRLYDGEESVCINKW